MSKEIKLSKIEVLLEMYKGDIVLINKRLKSLSSMKCNLKKKRDFLNSKEFDNDLKLILEEMENLKECKSRIEGKKVINFFDMEESEISELSYDSIMKGINSLSSIKCRNSYNVELVEEIEKKSEVFKKYKELNKDVNNGKIDNKRILESISLIEEMEYKEVNKDFILNLLRKMIIE